jgi:hypothetical protein
MPGHCLYMDYEDVHRLHSCAVCGSRRYCFEGRDWRCIVCEPSALNSPIRVELLELDLSPTGSSREIGRRPSVLNVSVCEITATPVNGRAIRIARDRGSPNENEFSL